VGVDNDQWFARCKISMLQAAVDWICLALGALLVLALPTAASLWDLRRRREASGPERAGVALDLRVVLFGRSH